jgi:hypothetical protein
MSEATGIYSALLAIISIGHPAIISRSVSEGALVTLLRNLDVILLNVSILREPAGRGAD